MKKLNNKLWYPTTRKACHKIGASPSSLQFIFCSAFSTSSPPLGLKKDFEDHVIDLLEYGDQYIEPEQLVNLGTRIYKEGASVNLLEIAQQGDNATPLTGIYVGKDKLEDLINNCSSSRGTPFHFIGGLKS